MRKPARIRELTDRMIEMSGQQINIVDTGLRPGEKIHEEPAERHEKHVPSGHPLIFRVRAKALSPDEVLKLKW